MLCTVAHVFRRPQKQELPYWHFLMVPCNFQFSCPSQHKVHWKDWRQNNLKRLVADYAWTTHIICKYSALTTPMTCDWIYWSNISGLKPGQATLDAIGGAHRLQSWPHNILTGMMNVVHNSCVRWPVSDSGGWVHVPLESWGISWLTARVSFQMVSLLKLTNVTEEGVRFLSPHDGSPM